MGKDTVSMAVAVLLILSGTASAEMRDNGSPDYKTPAIQVTGTGSVRAEPDTAVLRVSVTTEDANAQSAVSRNSAATEKVLAELVAASVDRKDLKTTNFSVYPQYRIENETKRQVTSYRASNTVMVTIRDIARVGDILAKVVAAGSNQISGPAFSVSNPEKYLEEARKKAVENAMSKAKAYANAAGMKLGSVLEMIEPGFSSPLQRLQSHGAVRSGAAAPVPVESGEESLDAQIVLVIELKQ